MPHLSFDIIYSTKVENMSKTQETTPLATPFLPLLRSESTDGYLALLDRLKGEIKPNGIVEQFYVEDMASLIFEVRRLQLCKIHIVNNAYLEALQNVLRQLLVEPEILFLNDQTKAVQLSRDWFSDKMAKQEVVRILDRFDLDESAIEAEAIRLKLPELESLDRMLALSKSRFDRSLRCVTEYKESLARRLRQSSEQMLQLYHVPVLGDPTNPAPAA
jgi:hypothetical protein